MNFTSISRYLAKVVTYRDKSELEINLNAFLSGKRTAGCPLSLARSRMIYSRDREINTGNLIDYEIP